MNINSANISVGDQIIAKKSTYLADEGKIGNVIDVTDNFISFAFDGNAKVSCTMDYNTFNHYFAKVEEKEEVLRITEEYIDEILENSEFNIWTEFDKCTVVSCQLPNGFVITESSACVYPDDYNAEIGEEICKKKIKDKVWELEAYRLQQYLWESSLGECSCDCEECPCNGCEQ